MANNKTIFQTLTNMFGPYGVEPERVSKKYSLGNSELLRTTSKEEYENQKLQARQNKYLSNQWVKVENEIFQKSIQYEITRIGAYSDFENMEFYPEIAATLDILMEESTTVNDVGRVLNIYSESPRVKGVLEDLFFNRLDVHVALPMWIRNMCKYGDNFLYLNTDDKRGVTGVKQLPNFEIERREGGVYDVISANLNGVERGSNKDDKVKFFWRGRDLEFMNWQVAHFRLLGDDRRLPYGTSILEKARRIWKQLLLSEDAMLVYRVTRAPERRIFKVFVGNIDDEDVQPYVNEIANRFKRASIIDPKTGQIDLRYNQLANDQDYFIPVREEGAATPIDTLPGACVALDTRIPLLDGRTLELSDIIKEWNSGNRDLWVYSCDPNTGELAPGMITWAGETRKNAEVLKITLDNGKSITTTPDHKWVHRTKGFVEAKDLVVGDSLMPFYTKKAKIRNSKSEYKQTWDSKKQKWVYDHRMVANYFKELNQHTEFLYDKKYINENKQTIHHININRYDNNPSNLAFMYNEDHYRYHSDNFGKEFAELGGKALKYKLNSDIEFRNMFIETASKNSTKMWANRSTEERKLIAEKQSRGLIKYLNSLSPDELLERVSRLTTPDARKKAVETFKSNPDREKIIKDRTIKASKTKSTKEFKEQFSKIAKVNWKSDEYRNKVFSKKQKLTFTDDLYNMFLEMFKLYGKADLTLNELNDNDDFMSEFIKSNTDIRSSLTNLNRFTHNHLEKMLKQRGFKNYRDWCKLTAESLGYKNVRAWRYFINKNKQSETINNYNHKIISIELLEEKIDTGTITVDGNEIYSNYHTFATESGVFIKNSNLDAIADIEYLQRKLFTALRVPKAFLGFDDPKGEGKNLALLDIRFARTVNRIQQAVLQELNKIAIIHLVLLGLEDEIDNFTITMNNPSTQAEMLRIQNLQTKVTLVKDATSDIGNGFSVMSLTKARRSILGWSDEESKQDFLQQRIEKAASAELENTANVIKHTGMFDKVDKLYGDIEVAKAGGAAPEEGGEAGGPSGGGGGGFGGGGLGGGDIDFGEGDLGEFGEAEGGEAGGETPEVGGAEGGGETPEAGGEAPEAGGEVPEAGGELAEDLTKIENLLTERVDKLSNDIQTKKKKYQANYYNRLVESLDNEAIEKKILDNKVKIFDEGLRLNEEIESVLKGIDELSKDTDE